LPGKKGLTGREGKWRGSEKSNAFILAGKGVDCGGSRPKIKSMPPRGVLFQNMNRERERKNNGKGKKTYCGEKVWGRENVAHYEGREWGIKYGRYNKEQGLQRDSGVIAEGTGEKTTK